jgi:hypothetical protein
VLGHVRGRGDHVHSEYRLEGTKERTTLVRACALEAWNNTR